MCSHKQGCAHRDHNKIGNRVCALLHEAEEFKDSIDTGLERMSLPPVPRFRGVVDPVRSRTMSRVRGRDTKPEMALRQAVFAAGGRYRTHVRDVPGWPDLCSKTARVAVFVDGCFWHACPRHFRMPNRNHDYWAAKIGRNKLKRAHVREALRDEWTVFEFYECELRSRIAAKARRVALALGAPRR